MEFAHAHRAMTGGLSSSVQRTSSSHLRALGLDRCRSWLHVDHPIQRPPALATSSSSPSSSSRNFTPHIHVTSPHRCPRQRCQAASSSSDFNTHQQLSRAIGMSKTLQDLRKLLEMTQLDANVVATSVLHTANLFLNLQAASSASMRDDQDPEAKAYQEIRQMLVPKLGEYVHMFPVDTRIALVVACVQLDWYDSDVAAVFELVADLTVEEFDANVKPEMVMMNLTMISAAYTTAGHYNSKLMDWLADKLVEHMDKFQEPRALASVLQAYWDLRHLHEPLLRRSADWILPRLESVDTGNTEPGELVSLGLAFATFDAGTPQLYAALLSAVSRCSGLKNLDPTTASLLQVLYLLVRHTGLQLPRKVVEAMAMAKQQGSEMLLRYTGPALVDEEYLAALTAAGVPYEDLQVSGALMGVQVERSLRLVGLQPARNIEAAEGFILVHQEVSYRGQQIALQLCDRSCFCSKPYWRFKGTVLNEMRALEKLGQKVIAVPWFEWDRLTTEAERTKYLMERISAAAAMPSTDASGVFTAPGGGASR